MFIFYSTRCGAKDAGPCGLLLLFELGGMVMAELCCNDLHFIHPRSWLSLDLLHKIVEVHRLDHERSTQPASGSRCGAMQHPLHSVSLENLAWPSSALPIVIEAFDGAHMAPPDMLRLRIKSRRRSRRSAVSHIGWALQRSIERLKPWTSNPKGLKIRK
mmetsp:Transcript_2350/g.5555  ORF Transcript_2350/g.5555 Transcript_2350/m.5555 type:complete len:159 (-) Transcript_2350:94-570(-)